MPLWIRPDVSIQDEALEETFLSAGGPGGQNVNKVASAAQLRFDASLCSCLPAAAVVRLARLAGRRMSKDGILVITARRFRTQERNRADARERLAELLREALKAPEPRRPTRPSRAANERRLASKAKASARKAGRRLSSPED